LTATIEMFTVSNLVVELFFIIRYIVRLQINVLELALNYWRKRPWIVLDIRCRSPAEWTPE